MSTYRRLKIKKEMTDREIIDCLTVDCAYERMRLEKLRRQNYIV